MESMRYSCPAKCETSKLPWIRATGVAVVTIVLNACGGGGSGATDPVPPRAVGTITVSPPDVTLEALGATSQLEASARDRNGNVISASFSWGSSNTAVVTVDSNGLVSAVSNGMATVTVRSGTVSASATVTVEQEPASISFSPDEVVMTALGANEPLGVSVFDANDHAMSAALTWASSNPAVATVDGDGTITAQTNGTATVTATVGSVSGSLAVTVRQAVASIDVVPETVTLTAIGQLAQLEATARDANGHPVYVDIGFESSEPTVAAIDDDGVVTGLRNGMTTVTASTGSVSITATVTVMQVLAGITMAPDNVELTAIGQSAQLEVGAVDANGMPMAVDVSLSSSNPAIASVNAAGVITAQANGAATITGGIGSVSRSVTVTVDQRVASVSIAPTDISHLDTIGVTVQLIAVARDANGHAMNVEFDWDSSDPSVATVDGTGLVTAQGDGLAEIRAGSGGYSDALRFDLSLRRAAQVTVTPPSSLLEAFDATVQLEVEVLDADALEFPAPVDWTSSNPEIAAVDASGLVTARGNGAATITARHGEAAGTASVRVLQRILHLRIEPEAPYFTFYNPVFLTSLGETVQFTVEALDPNGHRVSEAPITAMSYDNDVVSIDDRLLATATGNGDTHIRFLSNWAGQSPADTYPVRVRQAATSIEIDPTARTFRSVGETHRFTAVARDANGHALPADLMIWDTADRRIADVDTAGVVSIAGVGETAVTVSSTEGLSASATVTGALQTTCVSGDKTPSIDSVVPTALVEGATFEIRGRGFCDDPAGNLVTVDRMVVDVEASGETRLSVPVPQFDCLPSRVVEVSVAVGENRATGTVELNPDEPLVSVPVGRQAIWSQGQDKCLQFPAAADEEAYLIGVQSTVLTETDRYDRWLTPVRLIASTSETDASEAATPAPPSSFPIAQTMGAQETAFATGGPAAATLQHEPAFEIMGVPVEAGSEPVESLDVGPVASDTITFPDEGDIESLPEEGDLVTLPNDDTAWVVYKVGERALWLVNADDLERIDANSPDRIGALSEAFDNSIYPIVTDYFGTPDLGNIGRVVVKFAECCPGVSGNSSRKWYTITIYLTASLVTMVHEFVHVVQAAEAYARGGNFGPFWSYESQAQLGVEHYALVQTNRTTGQNYGHGLAWDYTNRLYEGWRDNFFGMPVFFGGADPERPQECSWQLVVPPCLSRNLIYFVGWSLQRWLTDQYGRLYPGGEANLHRELIRRPGGVTEAIEQQMGEPMETLLARWAAALYVDDRIPNLDPDLQFTTWNFYDIYRDHPERLMPLEIDFSDQEHRARIRDGSFWYVERIRFAATFHSHPCAGSG